MSKIIAIANQKGGVGKTTTAINLGAGLTVLCKSVLIIDLDPQANATSGLGFDKNTITKGIYEIMLDEENISNVILNTDIEWLDIIPATINLIGAEIELVNMLSRETKLKNAIYQLKEIYDYIFIDCPPSLGLLTVNALTCADTVLIPIQCEYFAMEGLTQLLKTIQLVRQQLNQNLELEGILLTMYNSRINLSTQVLNEVKKFFGNKVYNTIIPRNVRLAEAPSYGKSILEYAKSSKGAKEYFNLAEEFLGLQTY